MEQAASWAENLGISWTGFKMIQMSLSHPPIAILVTPMNSLVHQMRVE